MSLVNEKEIRDKVLRRVAEKMLAAARTAPKGKGVDNLELAIVEGDTIKLLASKMKDLVDEGTAPDSFLRDMNNILQAGVIVLLGTKIKAFGQSYCGMCGFKNCEEKNTNPDHPCVFNTGDLGIAVGSAVSIAMDERVDNRIMYTVGMAARDLGLLGQDVKIVYGIPLCISSKNPFFDR